MVRETRYLWVGNLPDKVNEERIGEHFQWQVPCIFSWNEYTARTTAIPMSENGCFMQYYLDMSCLQRHNTIYCI